MNEKLIKVYYGRDNLPYKDSERSVHFPIVGGAFLGASNTSKIRFYFDRIGDTSATYVSVAKLPNGKQGSQVLSKSSDSDGNYAELELSNWYTQAKGDVYIALQGYSGGVEYSYDSETELYEIHGTPIIQTTGSIKLAINYAPIGDSADYNDEFTTYQEILAALGDKIGVEDGIISVEITSILTTDDLLNNSAIGLNKPFVLDNMGETLLCYISEDSGTYTLKVIGKDSAYSCSFSSSVLVRNLLSDSVLDISYLPVINLSSAMQTLTSSELEIANQDNSIIRYNGRVFHKANETTTAYEFVSTDYDINDVGANNQITKYEISVNIASGTTSMIQQYLNIYSVGEIDALLSSYYTKTEIDNKLATKQNTLVNQVNIKSINGESLLGTGNIDIQGGGGGGTWGEITGDIQDQTDLQNELSDIREVAEGKNKTLVLSYNTTAPTTDIQAQRYKKPDGTSFTNLADFNSYVSGLTLRNSIFNSQDTTITYGNFYLISNGNFVYRSEDMTSIFKVGDIVLITEIDVPDRWVSYIGPQNIGYPLGFSKLETSKIDLTNYATKTDLSTALTNLAGVYDNTLTYTIGEVVIHDNKLYRCISAITTAESWDSTHWEQISVASGFVNLTGPQTISGVKTFPQQFKQTYGGNTKEFLMRGDGKLAIRNLENTKGVIIGDGLEPSTSTDSLGTNTNAWKDLYLSGNINLKGGTKEAVITCDSSAGLLIRDASTGAGITTNYISGVGPAITPYGTTSLGKSDVPWKNLYLSGNISDGNNNSYGLTLPDTTGWTANQEIASKGQTLVTTGTFANGEFTIDTSVTPITDGLYFFTYGNAQAFIYINSTMLANSGTSPIRTCMPVIYGVNGETNAGILRLSLSGTTLTVRVAVSGTQYVRDGFTMNIYKSNLM